MNHKNNISAHHLLLYAPFSIYNKGGSMVKSKTGKIRREIPNESNYLAQSFIHNIHLN